MSGNPASEDESFSRGVREERMRYEVLLMLHNAARLQLPGRAASWVLPDNLGTWGAEIARVIEFLVGSELVEQTPGERGIRITQAGVRFIEQTAGKEKRIPD